MRRPGTLAFFFCAKLWRTVRASMDSDVGTTDFCFTGPITLVDTRSGRGLRRARRGLMEDPRFDDLRRFPVRRIAYQGLAEA